MTLNLRNVYIHSTSKMNLLKLDPVAIFVTRCTNLVSVHYFLPLAISAKMLINTKLLVATGLA